MLSLEQAQAAILGAIRRAQVTETVALARASGRFLAGEVRAAVDNPAFDNSAMDGYAVRFADLGVNDFRLPLAGEASCGDAPAVLAPATAMRIFTGAPLPRGADTVVMQEDVRPEGEAIVFPRDASAGENVRRRGEDFRAGEPLYEAGRRLSAYDIALLATAGVAQLPVYRAARVLVVATGNELVEPGAALKPGQIYESNRLTTLLQLAELGVEAVDGGMVRDEPLALRRLLERAAGFADRTEARAAGQGWPGGGFADRTETITAASLLHGPRLDPEVEARAAGQGWPGGGFDFVITSGGASVGDRDLVKQVFAELGTINFWKVRIKPGKPIAFGHIGDRTHFFALPGNPVSSLVTFRLFVEPALTAWHHGRPSSLALPAIAANAFRRKPGRTEFLRARLYTDGGRLLAEALKGQGSHMLGPIRHTNGFIRLEDDSSGFEAGQTVTAIPL